MVMTIEILKGMKTKVVADFKSSQVPPPPSPPPPKTLSNFFSQQQSQPQPQLPPPSQPQTLFLSGIGMRKKTILFVNIDVYLIAIYVAAKELKRAQLWKRSNPESLSDELLLDDRMGSKNDVKVAATITFVREITQQQLLDAFDEAFRGCERTSIDQFKASLRSCLGDGNLKKDGTISFYWQPEGKLLMSSDDGKNVITLQLTEISKRLLDIYIHYEHSVSPELVKSIETNIPLLEVDKL